MQAQIALGRRMINEMKNIQKTQSRDRYNRWRKQAKESKLYLCTLFVLAEGRCPECGVDMYIDFMETNEDNKASLDHVNPISRTLYHDKLNLQIMCRKC